MGEIAVHEFITLDGVIGAPSWTMDYPFDPKTDATIERTRSATSRSGSTATST